MKGQTYVILGFIILIIVSVFAVINVEAVKVNFLFWTGESPLILVILFSVLMGGLVAAGVGSFKLFHLQRENKTLREENHRLQQFVSEDPAYEEIVENKTKDDKIEEVEQ